MDWLRNRLFWILLAVVSVLIVVGVLTGLTYLLLRGTGGTQLGWRDPVAALAPYEVLPELGLYPLAGASELETIDAAILNGDFETAYATLVFGKEVSDGQRIGRLQQLARGFVETGEPDRASISYQQVYDAAILSPMLSDPARAEALLAAGRGWTSLERADSALDAYDQVYAIAIWSPFLQPSQRWELLGDLAIAYESLGEDERLVAVQERITGFDEDLRSERSVEVRESPELPLVRNESVSTAEVGVLEEARRQAAYALLEGLSEGAEPPPGLVQDLAQALIAEDAAKIGLYRQELAATSQPGRRVNVHWQAIEWLLLKYKVAMGGVGVSVVPEWEEASSDIQSDLAKEYEDLYFDYEDLVTALPDAALVGPGSYRARRSVILAGRLGQYPLYPATQLAEKLVEAVESLISAGYADGLYVIPSGQEEGLWFFFRPGSNIGDGGTSFQIEGQGVRKAVMEAS
jgi:hypothetical protein